MKSYKFIAILIVIVAIPFSYGIYNIYKPEHYPIKFFRGKVIKVSDNLLFGPYPTEKELRRLKDLGVTEIVNLMNSKMPFETSLIEKEKLLAKKYKISFRSVPLNYLPNLRSEANLKKVRELVAHLKETRHKTYVHCYLGRHRTTLVIEHFVTASRMANESAGFQK